MSRLDSPLPTFDAATRRERTVLDASRAVVALFVQTRGSDFSVKELAEHTGLSERTFYRYFPRKEDAIRPYLAAGLRHLVGEIRDAAPDIGLREVLVAAPAVLLDAALDERMSAFFSVLSGTERLSAVWHSLNAEAEQAVAEAIAYRRGLARPDVRARLAGAAIVAAARVALAAADDPEAPEPRHVYTECLELLGPDLFEDV